MRLFWQLALVLNTSTAVLICYCCIVQGLDCSLGLTLRCGIFRCTCCTNSVHCCSQAQHTCCAICTSFEREHKHAGGCFDRDSGCRCCLNNTQICVLLLHTSHIHAHLTQSQMSERQNQEQLYMCSHAHTKDILMQLLHTQMRGTADALMKAGPHKNLSKYFFLVGLSLDL